MSAIKWIKAVGSGKAKGHFGYCRSKVITIEDYAPNLAAAAITPTARLLTGQGYELFARMGPTSVFRLTS